MCDIYSNTSEYSSLAAGAGSKVVSFHADDDLVTQAYLRFAAINADVLPLVMDFRNPSPGYGICNKFAAPATARLACDMVLALDCIPHFVFNYRLGLSQIAAGLAAFAKKWVLVAFDPAQDKLQQDGYAEYFAWYRVENFTKALQNVFPRVELVTSEPHPIFLCHAGNT